MHFGETYGFQVLIWEVVTIRLVCNLVMLARRPPMLQAKGSQGNQSYSGNQINEIQGKDQTRKTDIHTKNMKYL